MTTAVLDPKLQDLAAQIENAFSGAPTTLSGYGTGPSDPATLTHDASTVATSMLSAYQTAAAINPGKAYHAKAMKPQVKLENPAQASSKDFWDSVWDVVQVAGPIIVDAVSKDYRPQPPNLGAVMQKVPAHRRNDKAWVDYTTSLLLNLAQGTAQSLSGQKDFSNPANRPLMPQPPSGADKGFFDDALSFVQDAAPVALPIIMSLI
jgi:hypothetical protein